MSDFNLEMTALLLEWLPEILVSGILIAFAVWFIQGVKRSRREKERRLERRELAARMKHFAYAKIMESIPPMARAAKYEQPLGQTLEAARLGVITGAGTQMSEENTIAWVGIDLALADLDGAVRLTCQRLRELGAPVGSMLEYRIGGQQIVVEIA